jgi:NADPH2:quinone reductase
MKAWILDSLSGIGSLRLGDFPEPKPGPGEVVLAIRYAGLNPADSYLASRQYPAKPALPHILGRDGLGTVVELGPDVRGIALGETRMIMRGDVGGNRPGTFAERVAVPVNNLVEVPKGWTEEQAAGASLVYGTAYQALTMWGPLPEKGVVLITGASGGVGVASLQLAVGMGHSVVALSRSAEKSRKLRELGAAMTFDPTDPGWRKAAKEALGDRRVDLAIDNIGGKLLPEVIDVLGNQGKVSVVGRLDGPVPEFNTATLLFRRIRIGGVAVGAWTAEESAQAWIELLKILGRAGAKPVVDRVFPWHELPQAFQRLAQGPMGKVLLAVGTGG